MKKYLIFAACILALAWGCSSNKTDSHDHDHDHDHAHDHTEDGKDDSHSHDHEDGIVITLEQATLMGIETEKVATQQFHQVIKTSGQVVAAQGEERTIVATISGVVSFTKASANEGKPVSRGESLFSISSSNLVDGDPVTKAQSAYEIAKRDFDRAELLIVDKLISQKEYNEIKLTYESAKIAYNAIGGNGRAKGVNISSPIGGYIKSRLVSEGQFVNVGEPLMVVTQNNKLQLRADVSERYYGSLQTIKSANFKTPYDNALYKLSEMNGQLLSYGKSASDAEFFIPVNFQFDNVGNIVSGSFVEVFLLSGIKENVMTLPKTALIDEQGLFFVYTKTCEEDYERVEVKIGVTDGDRVEILGGLHIDDEVVVKGAYHVKLSSASGSIPDGHNH